MASNRQRASSSGSMQLQNVGNRPSTNQGSSQNLLTAATAGDAECDYLGKWVRENFKLPASYLAPDEASVQGSGDVPTNAWGNVKFPKCHHVSEGEADHVTQYVRMRHDESVDKVLDLLFDKELWGLEVPKLVISLTGGAKDYQMKPQHRDVVYRGLIKAATSAGGWLLDVGTNVGLAQHIGLAAHEHNLESGPDSQLVTLGIAAWGTISGNEQLECSEQRCGDQAVIQDHTYEGTAKNEKGKAPLDPNHSHFILCDNGTKKKYNVEIPLRTKLEAKLAGQHNYGDPIPTVIILLEGGPGSLETVEAAIEQETPVVIIKNSGRLADLIAKTHAYYHEESMYGKSEKDIKEEITKASEHVFGNKHVNIDMLMNVIKADDLLTFFDADNDVFSSGGINNVILEALLKVTKKKEEEAKKKKVPTATLR